MFSRTTSATASPTISPSKLGIIIRKIFTSIGAIHSGENMLPFTSTFNDGANHVDRLLSGSIILIYIDVAIIHHAVKPLEATTIVVISCFDVPSIIT